MPPPTRVFYQAWFNHDVVDSGYHHCICGKVYQQYIKSGYSNLMQHLKAAHKGYITITNANGTLQPAIATVLNLDKNYSLNKWADWIVMKSLSLIFCEDPHTRACTKLERVTRTALKAYMFATMKKVEVDIRESLPYSFGLVFDGWTTAEVHYVGRFAVFHEKDWI